MDREGRRGLAVPYWERACKLGLRSVCSELATILSEGKGVPRDHERAAAVESSAWR
jgi:TPR repeat protein